MPWKNRPFIRILLFFIAGIFFADSYTNNNLLLINIGILFILIIVYFTTKKIAKHYSSRWIHGFILYTILFIMGFILTSLHLLNNKKNLAKNQQYYKARVISNPEYSIKGVKFIAIMEPVGNSKPSFKTMVFLKTNPSKKKIHPGSIIIVKAKILSPEKPKNPYVFDYSRFLRNKEIRTVAFIKVSQWKLIREPDKYNITYFFYNLRNKLTSILKHNGIKGNSLDVAAAILLGNDKMIDPGLRQSYIGAGAVHILCVSGMHVGIIFLILEVLFNFLTRFSNGTFIKNFIILILIWFYAFLTGFSPSVLRASVMISFFIIGKGLNKTFDNFNLLAASAFVLLVASPLLLFDVGFQLSYAAVTGILLFYPPLNKIIYIKYKGLKIVWSVLVVSLSAQLGAFPVSIHYFHIFPVYFLFTNLLIFLLAYFIVISGIALFAFSWLPVFSVFLGKTLNFFIVSLNKIVGWISRLPKSTIEDIYAPWIIVLFIYAFILSIFIFLTQKKLISLKVSIFSLILIFGFSSIWQFKNLTDNKLIIFAINKYTAIDFKKGESHLLVTNISNNKEKKILSYQTKGYFISNRLHKLTTTLGKNDKNLPFLSIKNEFFKFNDHKIYILNPKKHVFPKLKNKITLDYFIYRGKEAISIKSILNSFSINYLIIDGSVPLYLKEKLKKEALKLKVPFWDVMESGAFILKE